MRQLHPVFRDEVDPMTVYDDPRRRKQRSRPYVFVNMVCSVDGGTVVEGVTEQLGGPADRHVFLLLRSLADGILVGAQTVRAEGYGPPKIRSEFAPARAERGQSQMPRIAIVTRSVDLDLSTPLFTDGRSRPFVLAPQDADPQRLAEADDVADVIRAGTGTLDLRASLEELARQGIAALLCEGGPTLNGTLFEQGLVDELCLTVSPVIIGKTGGARITGAPQLPQLVGLELVSVLEDDGTLFLRYLVGNAA